MFIALNRNLQRREAIKQSISTFYSNRKPFFFKRGNINSSCDSDNEGEKRVFPAHNWEECSSSPRTAALLLVSRCLMTISRVCVFIYATVNHYYTIYWGFLKGLTHTHTLFFFFLIFAVIKGCDNDARWAFVALRLWESCCCCCFICCTHPKQTVTWLVNKKKTGEERKEKWQWPPTLLRSLLLLDGMGYVRQCERKSLSLFASPSWCFFLSLFFLLVITFRSPSESETWKIRQTQHTSLGVCVGAHTDVAYCNATRRVEGGKPCWNHQ